MKIAKPPAPAYVAAINLLVAGAILIGIAAVPRGDRVVVIVAPWSASRHVLDVITEAGGRLVNSGRTPWIAVSDGTSVDYVQRLFSAGAIMVFDGTLFSACQRSDQV